MKLKVKRLSEKAHLPAKAHHTDAGFDLKSTERSYNNKEQYYEYETDLAIELEPGYVGLIFPRSSISNKDLMLTNHVGVIDENYRGAIKFRFKTTTTDYKHDLYEIGDKIGQLLIMKLPDVELEEVQELSGSERGTGGFGSSGS